MKLRIIKRFIYDFVLDHYMPNKKQEIVDAIIKLLSEGPKSINEISTKAEINWKTAEEYLKLLENLGRVSEKDIKNTRTFFYKDKNNYFELYIKNRDKKTISSVYSKIKKICQEKFSKEPTKTQVYKIIWKVNEKLNSNLPIGWYRYGPCSVQIYQGDEEYYKLDNTISKAVKETTEEYCELDNISLQKKVYEDAKKNLYLTKQKLIELNPENKEELNNILMDLIKFSPKETIEIASDFARATLLLGFENTRECFNEAVWKYITMVIFKESLESYYKGNLGKYFDKKIEQAQIEAQSLISDLVTTHMDAKHSRDKLYQRWTNKKK